LALAHMVHESPRSAVTLLNIHPLLDGDYDLEADRAALARSLIERTTEVGPLRERQGLLKPIAEALGLDYASFFADGRFRLLDGEEISALARQGVRIELHTHTHHLPEHSFEAASREIEQNRAAIRELIGAEPRHFCYPSGRYSAQHPGWLANLGISSATTCDRGFNHKTTPVLLLRRYLDNELTSDIEFEAEIVGVRELMRSIRARFAPRRN